MPQIGAHERKEACLDRDEDESGRFARYVLSTYPCDAARSQPVRVLRAGLVDELGIHEHCCEPAHLELELVRVVVRPAGKSVPWRIGAPQGGHHDLGLVLLVHLDRVVKQIHTCAHSLKFLCIQVDGARFAARFIVKRVNALKSSDLLKGGGPVPLLRLGEVKRHRALRNWRSPPQGVVLVPSVRWFEVWAQHLELGRGGKSVDCAPMC